MLLRLVKLALRKKKHPEDYSLLKALMLKSNNVSRMKKRTIYAE